METDRFTTLDLYLASYLSLCKQQPTLEVLPDGQVVFVFPQTSAISMLVEQFNFNASVPVAVFSKTIKTLRGQMLQARGPAPHR